MLRFQSIRKDFYAQDKNTDNNALKWNNGKEAYESSGMSTRLPHLTHAPNAFVNVAGIRIFWPHWPHITLRSLDLGGGVGAAPWKERGGGVGNEEARPPLVLMMVDLVLRGGA